MRTIAGLAEALAQSIEGADTDGVRIRLVRQFLMDVSRGRADQMLIGAPPPTGSIQWDALVAGVAEYAAHNAKIPVPAWTATSDKFLSTWWFFMPFASLHGTALAETPAALANRGVFISRDSLVNV
jgi:hypothetical protein